MTDATPAGTLAPSVARPAPGEMLDAPQPAQAALDLLRRRRSLKAIDIAEPGPAPDQIDALLEIAARVPDHGKLAPWRFIVLEGAARHGFGAQLAEIFAAANPGVDAGLVDFERGRFARAPLVVAVVSAPVVPHKIPEWEQVLSAGAVCQTLLVAATAMGFAAQWLTEWPAYDADAGRVLGLCEGERTAGFIYIGAAGAQSSERARPDVAAKTTRWGA